MKEGARKTKVRSRAPRPAALSNVGDPIDWAPIKVQRSVYATGTPVYVQGDPAASVMFLESGTVQLSVLSRAGKEAVISVLNAGHFFGEGCLVGQPKRMATASAMTDSTIVIVEKAEMVKQLHSQPAFADKFLTHMLTRNIRIEEDLIDQLFNSSERRLARTLLLLARYGEPQASLLLPKVSQETLAEMVGTTRSRVNFFMNRFKKLGFISGDDGITINSSLLSVVLHD